MNLLSSENTIVRVHCKGRQGTLWRRPVSVSQIPIIFSFEARATKLLSGKYVGFPCDSPTSHLNLDPFLPSCRAQIHYVMTHSNSCLYQSFSTKYLLLGD